MEIDRTTSVSAPLKIPDSPLFVAEIKDPAFDLHGWFVIHSFGSRGSCGGVRLYPDVSRAEVELLARAMTYKYCFHEVALGGAKAGLKLPFDVSPAERVMALRKFGEHIGPLIKSKIYCPWTDMNCSWNDIVDIYQGAGVKIGTLRGNSAYFTALSTFSSLLAAAEYYKIAPKHCQITIEGLGNVGKYLAIEINRWGGKLIGASTRIGAVVNLDGLDVKQIINTSEKTYDSWVKENGNWQFISKEQLFSLPMSIHIPCARVHSLTEAVAKGLQCRVVVPAANAPCTSRAKHELSKKGIQLLPDFVVNSGGVIGPGLHNLGSSDGQIRHLFFKDFKLMIERLLKLSDKNQSSPADLASIESHKNFQRLWLSGREKTKRNRGFFRTLTRRVRPPKKLVLREQLGRISRILHERFT